MSKSTFSYSHWRHGGWYVHDVRYPSGAIGCVSRNYPDKKWRIVCDPRFGARFGLHAHKTRDDAARDEMQLVQAIASGWLCTACGNYFEKDSTYCGLCGYDLREQKGEKA